MQIRQKLIFLLHGNRRVWVRLVRGMFLAFHFHRQLVLSRMPQGKGTQPKLLEIRRDLLSGKQTKFQSVRTGIPENIQGLMLCDESWGSKHNGEKRKTMRKSKCRLHGDSNQLQQVKHVHFICEGMDYKLLFEDGTETRFFPSQTN